MRIGRAACTVPLPSWQYALYRFYTYPPHTMCQLLASAHQAAHRQCLCLYLHRYSWQKTAEQCRLLVADVRVRADKSLFHILFPIFFN